MACNQGNSEKGDSENFVTRAWPTNVFQTALIEAAKSGGGIAF